MKEGKGEAEERKEREIKERVRERKKREREREREDGGGFLYQVESKSNEWAPNAAQHDSLFLLNGFYLHPT